METISQHVPYDYFPLAIQFGIALLFVVATMLLTHLVGPKKHGIRKSESFECGLDPEGNARNRFSVKYFLVAILFVLFDVEIIFLYPWAVNFKELGWFGFFEVITFMSIFIAGFYYVIKKGVLQWD